MTATATTISSDWLDSDVLSAFTVPPKLKPSEWAAEHIELPRGQSPRPGRLDHRNAPYLPGLIDIAVTPGVTQINVMKAAQVGVSECLRWYLAYMAATDPDPCGIALPDRDKGEKIVSNRIIPMFRRTPALQELATGRPHDAQKQQIKLGNGFLLHLMWSGSPSAMASDPMRWAVCDEVDKFALWAGREAHPVHLIAKRLRTYEDRGLQFNVSTPTTRLGMIYQLWESSDVYLYYLVPCPQCGCYQRLVPDRLTWDKFEGAERQERAKKILQHDAAWYTCASCDYRWSEREKRRAVQAGRWGTTDEQGLADDQIEDATTVERWPRGTRIGVHLSALYCMWERMAKVAAEWVRAAGNHSAMFDFRTQTLGEIFESQIEKTEVSAMSIRSKEAGRPERLLPWWTARVILAIDTQKDHFWFVVRAWGSGLRSARIFHGRANSFEELDEWVSTPWAVEENKYPPRRADLVVIDSGGGKGGQTLDEETGQTTENLGRTMQVYAWCMKHGDWLVRPIRGDSSPTPGRFIRKRQGTYRDDRNETPVPLWLLDVHHFQDELAALMGGKLDDGAPQWQLNTRDDPEYNRHMANLTKIETHKRVGGRAEMWVPVSSGARVDYRACEGYGLAAAYMAGVHLIPDLTVWRVEHEAEIKDMNRTARARGGLKSKDGRAWLASQR